MELCDVVIFSILFIVGGLLEYGSKECGEDCNEA